MRSISIALILFAVACSPKDAMPVLTVMDYLALQKGAYQVYSVDSVVVDQNIETTYHYELKTVVIDSDETARAIDFARKFFRDTMLDDVLGWTDVSNNKAWMAEQISCTNNAESILYIAKRDFPDIGKVTDQAMNPQGPKGRFHFMNSISHSVFSFSPVKQEARDSPLHCAQALLLLQE